MIEYRTMAILAGNSTVKFFGTNFNYIAMALGTKLMQLFPTGCPVLGRLFFPFRLVGLTVIRVHEPPTSRAKVVWNIEKAKYQHCYD
jgi:hypothetical protein